MEVQKFSQNVLDEMGVAHMSDIFEDHDKARLPQLREAMVKVIQSSDKVQRAIIFRVSKDRAYRSIVCPKK